MTFHAGDWQGPLDAADWSQRELWLAAFALGTYLTRPELDQVVAGRAQPSITEHNMLALALNERLHDLGHDRPVPYRDMERPAL